ncbi:acetyltransferase family protein [Clostridium sporogenes]|uniref:N-acetyltransferase n=1 Tax=Clostridium TaxID=1485 RepID=UPI000909E582|nr:MULTISPECIES: GNAT family N-acetyltransferase [Clostridium]APF28669.1 acetyltransferase family protein [Clostridium sporogenes]MDI6920305.1 GNAT family N-acetyltransferase [Clostridium botulinum]WMU96157.1 GNAT family N-acetyltransferase [Clostridium botulinum]
MNIISVDNENIDKEHICCAISDKKGETCISSKKNWMKKQFNEGLVFKKFNVRGKVFIEYIPAENAWCPIEAPGYMFINCFWVSGQFKGQGCGSKLLEECIMDAKQQNKKGLVILSSKKKMPFLSDPKYLKYKGFKTCDIAEPYYELLYLPFDENEAKPKFKECCKNATINEKGMVLYYSNQCPHTDKYALLTKDIAQLKKIKFSLIRYESKQQAQNAPSPFTTYSLFYDGKFVTNEILSENKFKKFLEKKGF